ncbi:MAG TPA: efflux RND transporter periplasmic adaptor subunit [Spirochaetia bacterium]|nr:efflux RND transporter periplasmic adaptor subunit [Spirochaetaceae bacterium]HPE89700.1 efflux RND transporter periplasmic adaptor subunit [Spirochaetales bacterium]HRW23031.1 efflux RND transporter periplasmic adaptor subunit [Spirochaetia bacterium]
MSARLGPTPSPGALAIVVAIVAAHALSTTACAASEAAEADEALPVRVAVAAALTLDDEIQCYGAIAYSRKVELSAAQSGVIASLPFREGDSVEKGDVVAVLTNARALLALGIAENGVASARAELALAEARLFSGRLNAESRLLDIERERMELSLARLELRESERKQADQEALFAVGGVAEETVRSGRFSIESAKGGIELIEREIASNLVGLRDEDLEARGLRVPEGAADRASAIADLCTESLTAERDAALASLEAAVKELEAAGLALAELTMTAPIAGVVGALRIEEGERAEGGDPVLTLIATDCPRVVFSVQEALAVRLSPGMAAKVIVDATGGEYDAVLDLVSPIADSGSASFSARAALVGDHPELKPGMFARVRVVAGPSTEAVVIPSSAAIGEGDQASALVVSGGFVWKRPLTLGDLGPGGRVVLSGLAAGEVVVDEPGARLEEGQRVSIGR